MVGKCFMADASAQNIPKILGNLYRMLQSKKKDLAKISTLSNRHDSQVCLD